MTHHQLDDHQMVMIYNQLVPDQGQHYYSLEEGKPWRRRKMNKGETSNDGVVRKRKLSEEQVNLLERSFEDTHRLGSERKAKLASELGLDPQQVAVWFQNRRARWKNKKLEDEYSKLKSHHEIAIIEKCRLENEILKIKEQLFEAQKEIQRLSLEHNGPRVSNNNSTLHQDSMEKPYFLGEFGMEDNIFLIAD